MTHKEKLLLVSEYVQHKNDCQFLVWWPTLPPVKIDAELSALYAYEQSRCSCGAVQARTLLQEVIEALK